jgi:hypothetical protein
MEGLGFGITISLNDLFTGALDNAINKFKGLEGVTEEIVATRVNEINENQGNRR